MFKRANKITSLLVVIAAVVSIVPSTITNASEKVAPSADIANTSTQSGMYSIGWSKLADGTWNFYDATGTKVTGNWVNFAGVWYYFKANGTMAIGWYQILGNWYYFNQSGVMLSNTVINGYKLNAAGAWAE
ncbi:MAG: hypothetical protein PHC75_10890 [Burkholderiales bacterium]|nr:hypothetical protein [Burkholderiales bacterium]